MCKFDLSSLSSPEKIAKAFVSLFFIVGDPITPTEHDICSLYTIAKEWKEMEVSWNKADKDTPWDQLDVDTRRFDPGTGDTIQYPGGGDRRAQCRATTQCVVAESWEHYEVTAVIKEMVSGHLPNYGFLIKPSLCGKQPHTRNQGRNYASSNDARVQERPKLTILYSQGSSIKSQKQLLKQSPLVHVRRRQGYISISSLPNTHYDLYIMNSRGVKIFTVHNHCSPSLIASTTNMAKGIYFVFLSHNHQRCYTKFFIN